MAQASPEPDKPLVVAAREDFAAWVRESEGGRSFAQVLVRYSGEGYEIRHLEDIRREDLSLHTDPRAARDIAATTESGEHRPLKSSPNLRRGWLLRLEGEEELSIAMNYLYPAVIVHWHLHRRGELEITNFRDNAARQSGIYERVRHLTDRGVQNTARACCEDAVCLKRRLWDIDRETPLEAERGEGEIPCPEPCSLFISFARRVRIFEREREQLLEGEKFTASEREDLASLVGAAASGEVEFAREGEFEKPLNVRRMRYRSLTLTPLPG